MTAAPPIPRIERLVWLDSRHALFLAADGGPLVEIASSIPTPHNDGRPHDHDRPIDDLVERRRRAYARRYFAELAGRLGHGERVAIVGPGPLRAELVHFLTSTRPDLTVETHASGPRTRRQLAADLRALNADPG